jgi:TRAP-type mannitol/chloroaromatic compound transport system permease large subunit
MLGPELQIIIVTLIFLGLLTAGMAVPFAIAVPAVIYLLMQGGFSALNGLGLMSWGSMNTFALTAVPLFMFMADILSVSGLSNRIYNGLAKLVAPLPGGLLQTNIAGCAIFASVSGSSIATAARSAASRCRSSPAATTTARSRPDRSRRAARSAS